VAIVGCFRRRFVEILNVSREPKSALGTSPKSTLPYCNFREHPGEGLGGC